MKMQNASLLHFAPERMLSNYISDQKPSLYVKADLFPSSDDIVKINMLDIPYKENYFDFVIANHVLEHVNDLSKALSELHRVLKVGGYAILQTPFSDKLHHTLEDKGINTDKMRLEVYGQEDHVRLFGADIFKLISDAGFVPHITTHLDILSEMDPRYWGVNVLEPLFLFEKINHD
jgi:SAM-dependent methyltransferase